MGLFPCYNSDMATHITTLIENHQDPKKTLRAEHGLSFFIRHNGTTLILDTGQSDGFIENAAALGVDLSTVQHIVISHSHYDHTDGLPHLMEHLLKSPAGPTLHLHRDFFHKKYADEEEKLRYNGPSWDETTVKTWAKAWASKASAPAQPHPVTLKTTEETGTTIAPDVHLVTRFARTHPLEVNNPRFVVRRTAGDSPLEIDDFRDEQCIVLETAKGLVVLVGCSHPGIMNMLDTIRSRFNSPIYAVLGGTHLVEAQGPRLEEAVTYLTDGTIDRLGLSHCTGDTAMAILADKTERFFPNVAGTVFSVS